MLRRPRCLRLRRGPPRRTVTCTLPWGWCTTWAGSTTRRYRHSGARHSNAGGGGKMARLLGRAASALLLLLGEWCKWMPSFLHLPHPHPPLPHPPPPHPPLQASPGAAAQRLLSVEQAGRHPGQLLAQRRRHQRLPKGGGRAVFGVGCNSALLAAGRRACCQVGRGQARTRCHHTRACPCLPACLPPRRWT